MPCEVGFGANTALRVAESLWVPCRAHTPMVVLGKDVLVSSGWFAFAVNALPVVFITSFQLPSSAMSSWSATFIRCTGVPEVWPDTESNFVRRPNVVRRRGNMKNQTVDVRT